MSLFTKLWKVLFHTSQQAKHTNTASPNPWTLFTRLDELPLYNFVQVLVHSKLEFLVKSGTPPVQELAATWGQLFMDFIDLNRDAENDYLVLLHRDIVKDAWTLAVEKDIEMYLLEDCPPEEKEMLCRHIAFRGFKLEPSYNTPEEFEKDYNRIIGKISPIKLRNQSKINEYNRYKASREGNTIDEAYFDGMLIRLWKHYKMVFRARELMTSEFVLLTKEYFKDAQEKNKALEQYGKPHI